MFVLDGDKSTLKGVIVNPDDRSTTLSSRICNVETAWHQRRIDVEIGRDHHSVIIDNVNKT